MRKWIRGKGESIIGISEGAFETFPQDYRLFETNYKIPGPPKGGKEDEGKTPVSTSVEYPSEGNRSGVQRKRKREEREKKKRSF